MREKIIGVIQMSTILSAIKPHVPQLFLCGDTIYQDYYLGLTGSDLVYPLARVVSSVGESAISKESPKRQNGVRAMICVSFLAYGFFNRKDLFVVGGQLTASLLLNMSLKLIRKRMSDQKGSVEAIKEFFSYRACLQMAYALSLIYFHSRINKALNMKPYYTMAVVLPLVNWQADQFLHTTEYGLIVKDGIRDLLENIKGAAITKNELPFALYVLTSIVYPIFSAGCLALATGERIKKNWTVHIISQLGFGASKMYL
jgi:hypothetical protein